MEIDTKAPLSTEFMVAVAIYEATMVQRKRIWFNKLVKEMKGVTSRATVSKAVRQLLDWGIVKVEYGETEDGRAGKLLTISASSMDSIRDLYKIKKAITKGEHNR